MKFVFFESIRYWDKENQNVENYGIIDYMDMGLGGLRELVMDREAWHAAAHGVAKSQTQLSDWTELSYRASEITAKFWIATLLQRASLLAQLVKNPPTMRETPVQFLDREDLLEKGEATHSSVLRLPLWLSW